ncbi:MAG: NYN domain-containing protein [Silicimonas sp.]|nr:NYN domain-containing protein [Silicimonas sp.]
MAYSSVALLIDGDNISSDFAGQIMRRSSDLGPSTVRRVYCNAATKTGWDVASSFRIVHSGAAKNASDIILSIEAVELALVRGIEAFVIATSDQDLSHIAHFLREQGKHVLGLGEEKAPSSFRFACSKFDELNHCATPTQNTEDNLINRTVLAVLRKHDPHRRGLLISRLNGFVRRENDEIKIKDVKEKTWAKYLAARQALFTVTGDGAERMVHVTGLSEDT